VTHQCDIPRPNGDSLRLTLEAGESIVIIGANGSGKTRLGARIEYGFQTQKVQRIAAQKSLILNDQLNLISFERAQNSLRTGHPNGDISNKQGSRWGNNPAVQPLNDFDALLQTLFAAHNRIASKHLKDHKANQNIPVPVTPLDQLKEIWNKLLPHRTLDNEDAAMRIFPPTALGTPGSVSYPGSEMSDGERAIFYFLGQCLLAPEEGVVIVDEPEGHIHKAILEPLWHAIEAARPDCGFIYITHDLDFAVTHAASAKYFIRAYTHQPPQWDIEQFPHDTGLPEQVVAEIVGSRKPILFVEGDKGSLDLTIYLSHYKAFTVIPSGGCEAVIHSVASYRGSSVLHWLGAHGVVDADDRDAAEINYLSARHVFVLPVAEVENLLLWPPIFLGLAEALMCSDPANRLADLTAALMKEVSKNVDQVSARYTKRQLDRRLKRLEVDGKDLGTLTKSYLSELGNIDPADLYNRFKKRLEGSIAAVDLESVLKLYDNKGLACIIREVIRNDSQWCKVGYESQ